MAKFPSQRKLIYEAGDISKTTMASEGYINLPKDLSIMNRRGYASTTRKGVPLVFQCKVDWYLHDDLGTGPATAPGSDLQATMKMVGVQNNWVIKNAAVKWHAARENMFARAGITKGSRGAYAHEIRYGFDAHDQTWLTPIDGDGAAFTGGTWDLSDMTNETDVSFKLKLVGSGTNEESSDGSVDAVNIGHSYLLSRMNLDADTNRQSFEGPADKSILRGLLQASHPDSSSIDDLTEESRDAQDNPPYEVLDLSDSGDVNHDITESVELGRAVAGFGNAYGSAIVEIPFGLCDLRAQAHDAAGTNTTFNGLVCVEVLDIYEMQG